MDKSASSTDTIPIDYFKGYLQLNDWELIRDSKRWCVFHGRKSVSGRPFEIALPKLIEEDDYRVYVQQALKILSSLTSTDADVLAKNIMRYASDLCDVRVRGEADATSVPLDLAFKDIQRLRNIVRFGACSERNAMTYFSQALSIADKMLRHYQFGHTISGSFSYSVESPVEEADRFHSKPKQLELPLILPLQRRVMERIARGLIATEKSAKLQSAQPLIEGYGGGFNANMCDALLEMGNSRNEPLVFNITWSKKLEASDGVKRIAMIRFDQEHFRYLEIASTKLKTHTPELKAIKGVVVGLSSPDDPRSDDVKERFIILKWDRGRGRPRQVHVSLEKEDYITAHEAHLEWRTISVIGDLQKKGSIWQLADPQDFRILY